MKPSGRARAAFILAICTAAAGPDAHASENGGAKKAADAIVMDGIDLYLDENGPTFGEVRNPTFWVHAARGEWSGSPRVWALQDANAIIYRGEDEDLQLRSASGTFDEEQQVAELRDGVRATTGGLVVDLEDIRWDNRAGVARSEMPVVLSDGVNRLAGRSVSIYPRRDRIELGAGTGSIQIAGSQPEKDAGTEASGPEDSSGYRKIELKKYGGIEGNLRRPVNRIVGGVELSIEGTDPENTLSIKAGTVEFIYASETDRQPSIMRMEGAVEIKHLEATISADRVEIDFESRIAKFNGNAAFDNAMIRGVRAPWIELNLRTQEFKVGPGSNIVEIQPDDGAPESKEPAGARP